MIVSKDIFYAGTFTTPDGRTHTFTPADVRGAFVNGRAHLSRNLAIPGIYEHDARAEPVPLRAFLSAMSDYNQFRDWGVNFAKSAYGHIQKFGLKETKSGPVVFAEFDVDPEDAARLQKAKFVSCRVDRNYVSPDGRVWPGWSICHVASTPRPVQTNQLPFRTSAMLSATGKQPRESVYLSYEGATMADDTTVPADDTKKPNNPATGDWLARVLTAMALLGKPLPDSVTDGESLALALEVLASANNDLGDDGLTDLDGAGMDDTTSAGGQPIMLSQLTPAQQTAYRIQEQAARSERVRLAKTVTSILTTAGHMQAPRAAGLVKRAESVSLSMLSNGTFTSEFDPVLNELKSVASTLKGRGGKRTKQVMLSQTIAVGIPDIPTPGEMTAEQKQKRIEAKVKEAEDRVAQWRPSK